MFALIVDRARLEATFFLFNSDFHFLVWIDEIAVAIFLGADVWLGAKGSVNSAALIGEKNGGWSIQENTGFIHLEIDTKGDIYQFI